MAGMLFAQAIGVAQACVVIAPSPNMAFSQGDHDGHCGKALNQNACLLQCTAGDQSSAQVQVAVAMLPAVTALTVPYVSECTVLSAAALVSLSQSPDPPRSIRFCSFQL